MKSRTLVEKLWATDSCWKMESQVSMQSPGEWFCAQDYLNYMPWTYFSKRKL